MFGQSSEDKKFAVRTSIFAHALTYNLDKNNAVGYHFGQLSTKINEDNIEKGVNSFIGVNYAYAFNCINCDSFFIITLLGPYSAVFTTDDGSTGSASKQSENLKSDNGYGKDVEDRVKKLSFQPISSTPLFALGYSF